MNPPADVSESQSSYDIYPVAPRSSDKPAADRCAVGFWNLSGRDVSIRIDGKTKQLGPGKSASFDLARTFIWQVDGREPQKEEVAASDAGLEIIIRR